MFCTGVVIMWIRISLNAGGEPIFKKEEMRAAFHPDRSVRYIVIKKDTIFMTSELPLSFRILSFLNIYSWNSWLLLSPSRLCCDWTLGSLPLVTTLTDARNLLSLFLLIILIVLALFTLNTARYTTKPPLLGSPMYMLFIAVSDKG